MERPTAVLSALSDDVRLDVMSRLTDKESAKVEPDSRMEAVELHHKHLPKLEDVGLIEYTKVDDGYLVERATGWDDVEPLLQDVGTARC